MGHSHHHHQQSNQSEKNIRAAFFLNLFFAIIEVIGGLFTNSIAILSDALHDLGDSLTLGVSWYFARLAKRRSNQSFTYGYRRFSILGALLSSVVLLTGSVFIITEAIPRLLNPINPDTQGMIILAIFGVAVNGIAAYRLSHGHTINERAVFTHLLEDILGWVATLIGALIMHFYDFPIIDPLLSVLISAYILYNVIRNLKESFRIILQGTPSDIDVTKIHEALLEITGVRDFHDCHTWSMDGEYHILSVHLVVEKDLSLQKVEKVKLTAKQKMKDLGINHATIEFETPEEDCEPC